MDGASYEQNRHNDKKVLHPAATVLSQVLNCDLLGYLKSFADNFPYCLASLARR